MRSLQELLPKPQQNAAVPSPAPRQALVLSPVGARRPPRADRTPGDRRGSQDGEPDGGRAPLCFVERQVADLFDAARRESELPAVVAPGRLQGRRRDVVGRPLSTQSTTGNHFHTTPSHGLGDWLGAGECGCSDGDSWRRGWLHLSSIRW